MIRVCYDLLGLISFLTAGEPEGELGQSKGTSPQAAGKIHSDIERDLSEPKSFTTMNWSKQEASTAKEKVLFA